MSYSRPVGRMGDKRLRRDLQNRFDALDTAIAAAGGGASGNTILNGSGVPSAGLGADGDFYIDTTNDNLYGPKSGTWGSATSLIGATGAAGADGATGPQGNTGATGATGATGPAGSDGQGVPTGGTAGQVLEKIDGTNYNTQWATPVGLSEYMVPIWAEENATLGNNTYEWAFGNGANTGSNNGITIYVPTGMQCHIVAMTATTNNASGSSVIEANINGTVQGALCNVTLSGRSGVNDSFTPVSLSSGDRLTFRTTTAGTNSGPNTVTAWLRYQST